MFIIQKTLTVKQKFDTGHEYGIRDRELLSRGLDRILNFVLMYVRKK